MASPRNMRKVQGTKGVWLIPSSQNGDVPGRSGLEYAIATMPEVRAELNSELHRAYGKSWARLNFVRAKARILGKRSGNRLDIGRRLAGGKYVDAYLILRRNQDSITGPRDYINLLAAEWGRGDVTDGTTEEGQEVNRTYGGAGVLHAGFDLRPGDLRETGGGDF